MADRLTRTMIAAFAGMAALATGTPAAAATFTFTSSVSVTGGAPVTGAGTITASDTPTTGFDGSFTGFLAAAISGTYHGADILGLVPVDTLGRNDNLINTSTDLVDFDGIAFLVDAVLPGYDRASGYATTVVNFYGEGNGFYTDSGPTALDGTFTLTAVPEPGSWALMLVGLGGVGFALRGHRLRALAAPLPM